MPATVTLNSTTLAEECNAFQDEVRFADTSNITPGLRMFIDRELMACVERRPNGRCKVLRGVDGTGAAAHVSNSPVVIGRGDQFYGYDPSGMPDAAIPVSPWINIFTGQVWFAQGDTIASGSLNRWWQAQTATYDTVGLGIRTQTLTPTSST